MNIRKIRKAILASKTCNRPKGAVQLSCSDLPYVYRGLDYTGCGQYKGSKLGTSVHPHNGDLGHGSYHENMVSFIAKTIEPILY